MSITVTFQFAMPTTQWRLQRSADLPYYPLMNSFKEISMQWLRKDYCAKCICSVGGRGEHLRLFIQHANQGLIPLEEAKVLP